MAGFKTIALELGKTFVLYRQPTPAKDEFELLVSMWSDLFADVNDAEFCEAMRLVQASSRFFPVPADVMRQVEARRRQAPKTDMMALPEHVRTIDEQCALNLEQAARIRDLLNRTVKKPGYTKNMSVDTQLQKLRAWEAVQ